MNGAVFAFNRGNFFSQKSYWIFFYRQQAFFFKIFNQLDFTKLAVVEGLDAAVPAINNLLFASYDTVGPRRAVAKLLH